MNKKAAEIFVFYLISIVSILYLQSCYTTVKKNEINKQKESNAPSDSLPPGTCIIEGVVHDFTREVPTQEIDTYSLSIFYLDNYFWVYGTPTYSIKYIFLEGIDIAYLNKQVRIVGIIQNAPSSYYVNVQNPLNIRVYVSKIEILR